MVLVPTERLQPPANENVLGPDGQLTQAWAQHFQRVSDQTKSLSDALHTGTTTDDDAPVGFVGEYLTAADSSGLSTGFAANVAMLSLTAGDWDVWGSVHFVCPGTRTAVLLSASLASGVAGGLPTGGGLALYPGSVTGEGGTYPVTPGRVSIAETTLVYMVAAAVFAGGAMTASGFLAARRAR